MKKNPQFPRFTLNDLRILSRSTQWTNALLQGYAVVENARDQETHNVGRQDTESA